jgi:hypothetical protein
MNLYDSRPSAAEEVSMKRSEVSLWPGALAFVVAFALSAAVAAPPGADGWRRGGRAKTAAEPLGIFLECWFYPWSWCVRPPDPKHLAPDVPAGCCSDTCVGPCQ